MSVRYSAYTKYTYMYLIVKVFVFFFFFSSRRRHTRYWRDWSSDVCSSDLRGPLPLGCASPGERRPVDAGTRRMPRTSPLAPHRPLLKCAVFQLKQIGRASCRERV